MLSFFALIVAMFITMMLIPPLMRYAERFSFVDMPDPRKVHMAPVPRIGGVAMVIGAVTPMLLWADPSEEVRALLYGVGLILVFGVWDDRAALDFRIKFLGQLIAVFVVVHYGGVCIRYIPFHSFEPIPDYVAYPLTIFALLGVTNAINLSDGSSFWRSASRPPTSPIRRRSAAVCAEVGVPRATWLFCTTHRNGRRCTAAKLRPS